MEKKERKVSKYLEIYLPLQLLGCQTSAEVHVDIYDDGDIEVFMPVSTENLNPVLVTEDMCNLATLDFIGENGRGKIVEFHCTHLSVGRCVNIPLSDALKKICKGN